jgi:hypothetical protein
MHAIFIDRKELELYHPLPFGTKVNGQYYCAPLQAKVESDAHCNQLTL